MAKNTPQKHHKNTLKIPPNKTPAIPLSAILITIYYCTLYLINFLKRRVVSGSVVRY